MSQVYNFEYFENVLYYVISFFNKIKYIMNIFIQLLVLFKYTQIYFYFYSICNIYKYLHVVFIF